MTKEMNDITLHEATTPREDTLSSGLVISQTPALKEVSKALTTLKKNIDHDTPITKKHLKHLEGALRALTVDVGGEQMTIEEIKNNPDLKENILLWQEIAAGNFENHNKITFLTPRVAHLLSAYEGNLYLDGITTLSDTAAQALAKHQGILFLDGITTLTDTVAQALATHKGNLSLDGITTLTDTVAQALAQHQGIIHCKRKIKDHINRFR
mgnify:CR=1 FL=1